MQVAQEERLARNEAFFREVNERIKDVADSLGGDEHPFEFLCECADPGCTDRIPLTFREYEHVRADGTRFVLAPGHVRHEIEDVVDREQHHVVVEKVGVAGGIATQLDPRAAI